MELFVLAFLGTGLRTSYDFLKLGLSTAVVNHSLRHLVQLGFAKLPEAESAAKRHSVTEAGLLALNEQWSSVIAHVPADVDSVLRRAWVAFVLGHESAAIKYLRTVASEKQHAAAVRRLRRESVTTSAQGYRGARNLLGAARREAEANALFELIHLLTAPERERMTETDSDVD